MVGRSSGTKMVFNYRRSRWTKLFTEPDLNTVVLPILGIASPPPHPRLIKKKKWKLPKIWWDKN